MTGSARRSRRFWIVGVLAALLLAGVVSGFKSTAPDGLERVAETVGISEQEQEHPAAASPLSDYQTRGVENPRLSEGLAGVAGVVVVLALAGGAGWVLRRRSTPEPDGVPAPKRSGSGPDTPDGTEPVGGAGAAEPAHGS